MAWADFFLAQTVKQLEDETFPRFSANIGQI